MNRLGGIFFIAMAALIALHTVAEPLYHVSTDSQPYAPIWYVLDVLMVLSAAIGVAYVWGRKRALDRAGDDAPVSRVWLTANLLFYGYLFIGIMLLWNCFILISPQFTAIAPGTVSLVWIIIDAALPLLFGATGAALLRNS